MAHVGTFANIEQRLEQTPDPSPAISNPAGDPAPDPIIPEPPAISQPDLPQPSPDTTPAPDAPSPEPEPEIGSSSFSLALENEPQANPQPLNAPAPPSYNWKEEIKKVDKGELYKELGLNDFALEMNDYISRGGKPADYLTARAIDYNSFSDEMVIKSDMKKKYGLTDSQIDSYFNKNYGVSENDSDDDKEFASAKLKMDAKGIRDALIADQQRFKLPDAIQPAQDEGYLAYQQQVQDYSRLVEENKNFYLTHEATKALNESKRVAINLGNDVPAFNFKIDQPEAITRTLTDNGETWKKLTSTKTGEPDVPKQQLLTLFAYNPQKFCEDVFNYGRQMAKREIVAEGQNARKPQAAIVPISSDAPPTYSTGKFADKQR